MQHLAGKAEHPGVAARQNVRDLGHALDVIRPDYSENAGPIIENKISNWESPPLLSPERRERITELKSKEAIAFLREYAQIMKDAEKTRNAPSREGIKQLQERLIKSIAGEDRASGPGRK
jgi:hypothetical protein